MKNSIQIKDLTGEKFGRLTVIGIQPTETRKTYWICQCDCGNLKVVRSDSLQAGRIRSCGCLKKEQDKINLALSESKKKYAGTGIKVVGSRLYGVWQNMKTRCYNPHNAKYHRYGGRGIRVCDEWKDNYIAFHEWAITHGYSDELTIDRIDNDGDYTPDNCRWTTVKEQCRNRSTNINITIGKSTRTLMKWCEIFNLDYGTISARYQRNGFISIDRLFN